MRTAIALLIVATCSVCALGDGIDAFMDARVGEFHELLGMDPVDVIHHEVGREPAEYGTGDEGTFWFSYALDHRRFDTVVFVWVEFEIVEIRFVDTEGLSTPTTVALEALGYLGWDDHTSFPVRIGAVPYSGGLFAYADRPEPFVIFCVKGHFGLEYTRVSIVRSVDALADVSF